MPPPRRDLRRLVDGVSLVLRESISRAGPGGGVAAQAARGAGSLESLIFGAVKSALVSATDIAGLTSGRVHRYSDSKHNDSVVYFSDPEPDPHDSDQRLSAKEKDTFSHAEGNACSGGGPSTSVEVVSNKDEGVVLASENNESVASSSVSHVAAVADMPAASQQQQQGSSNEQAPSTAFAQKPTVPLPVAPSIPVKRRRPRERRVPSTTIGRALGFAGLGAGLAWGTIQESAKRIVYGTPQSSGQQSAISPFLSEQNAERLALALCRMRGAALKLGQMLSIQDESLVPAPILAALDIVRQGADVMPRSQLNNVLDSELGLDWSKKLESFDYEPLAAASIGQVHRAVTKSGMEVAMKIQYPGVADSIDSDIENVRRLLDYTNLIPKGLFLDRAMKVAKEELSRECDYELEATNQKRFRQLLSNTDGVYVPIVIDELSSRKVLTTELVLGSPIDKIAALNQETRNYVGRKLLELTLQELFVFRFMQTDPNWSNFLYDVTTNTINLIDFGAAREYRKGFVDDYLRMVMACANHDKEAVVEMSKRLGFLTGMESEVMLDAHVQASFIVGLPFSTRGSFDFRASNITSSISHLGATMLKHRLTPPPDEVYSLHRKLSGAFLACIKLGVVVPCRDLLLQVYQQYRFSDENEETAS